MTDIAKALQKFYSGFGIPAYEEQSVPDTAQLPYITYELIDPGWREAAFLSANVWYKGSSYGPLFKKVDEISDKIGEGLRIPTDTGNIYLYKGTPFSQVAPTDSDNVKTCYLLIGMHAMCK